MSEDQQKQPESVDDQTQTPLTPDEAGQSGTEVEKISKTAEPPDDRDQPFLKAQSIKVLRGTIDLLEGIVERLETEPVRELTPPSMAPSTTSQLASISDTTTAVLEPEPVSSVEEAMFADAATVAPESVTDKPIEELVSKPTKANLLDRLLPSFRSLQGFWDTVLAKVRSLLPGAWNQKWSDWGLTSAIAGIVVLILLTTVVLLPKTPAQVAKAPPNTIDAPPELKAPEPPQPVEVAPPPMPELPELTPEQGLIAAIQNQVAEVTERYGNGLIQSIEANFPGSRLVVKVSDGWYNLKPAQQDKLADEVLRRSNELDFSKLEITDPEGTLLARSPVVGSNMVILKRQELAALSK